MAAGKSAARPRFQVPLERDRSLLIGELHDDIDLPGPPTHRVEASAGIVCLEPGAPITRDGGVGGELGQILQGGGFKHHPGCPPSQLALTLGRYGGHPSRVYERAREGG